MPNHPSMPLCLPSPSHHHLAGPSCCSPPIFSLSAVVYYGIEFVGTPISFFAQSDHNQSRSDPVLLLVLFLPPPHLLTFVSIPCHPLLPTVCSGPCRVCPLPLFHFIPFFCADCELFAENLDFSNGTCSPSVAIHTSKSLKTNTLGLCSTVAFMLIIP